MKSVSRALAILFMGPFLLTLSFAEDAASSTDNSTKTAVPFKAPALTHPLAFAEPSALPKTNAGASTSNGSNTPLAELFLGYSFIRFNTKTIVAGSQNFDANGGDANMAFNVNRWFGLVADLGGYTFHQLPNGTGANTYTYLFGPRFSHRGERVTPFVHTLFGGMRIVGDLNTNIFGPSPNRIRTNAFATALGGGLDWNVSKRVAIRLPQVEYLLSKFNDGNDNQQNNMRASAGLVFRFGGNPPPPPPNHPPTVSVTANPTKVIVGSGDSVVLQSQAADPDNDTLNYKWTATGGGIEGSGPEVRWNTSNLTPGKYTATVTVDDGKGGNASSSTDITVEQKPNSPPTITCSADKASVTAGTRVAITANASDPDNDPLSFTWSSTGGRIFGTGANVQFDTAGVAPGTYTISGHVSDGKGGEANCTVTVDVQAPAPPPEQKQLETRLSLHSVYFPTAQPTVANPNGGLLASQQRTLVALASDFKKYLAFKPDAHLILQGHADPRGGPEYNKLLSDRRVERTKSFLVQQGVAADHIETQGLGEEQPMSADQVKQAVSEDQTLSTPQKAQLNRNARVLALAQSRRVDVTLNTTGQTSVRTFPFNAEDALNLINPKGTGTGKAGAAKGKGKRATGKGPGATKKR